MFFSGKSDPNSFLDETERNREFSSSNPENFSPCVRLKNRRNFADRARRSRHIEFETKSRSVASGISNSIDDRNLWHAQNWAGSIGVVAARFACVMLSCRYRFGTGINIVYDRRLNAERHRNDETRSRINKSFGAGMFVACVRDCS